MDEGGAQTRVKAILDLGAEAPSNVGPEPSLGEFKKVISRGARGSSICRNGATLTAAAFCPFIGVPNLRIRSAAKFK